MKRVADHLLDLGYALNDEDIHYVNGGIHKTLNDTIECWHADVADPKTGKEVSIYSAYTLTQCAAGIVLEPNTPDSDLYGDLLAIPKREHRPVNQVVLTTLTCSACSKKFQIVELSDTNHGIACSHCGEQYFKHGGAWHNEKFRDWVLHGVSPVSGAKE